MNTTTHTINAKSYLESLMLSEMGEEVATEYYGDVYICDAISETADSNVSIFTADQKEFAEEYPEIMRAAIDEGLALNSGDYFKANPCDEWDDYMCHVARCAWYMKNEEDLYNDLHFIKLYIAVNYIKDMYGNELAAQGVEAVELANIDDCDTFDEIKEMAEDEYEAAIGQ